MLLPIILFLITIVLARMFFIKNDVEIDYVEQLYNGGPPPESAYFGG